MEANRRGTTTQKSTSWLCSNSSCPACNSNAGSPNGLTATPAHLQSFLQRQKGRLRPDSPESRRREPQISLCEPTCQTSQRRLARPPKPRRLHQTPLIRYVGRLQCGSAVVHTTPQRAPQPGNVEGWVPLREPPGLLPASAKSSQTAGNGSFRQYSGAEAAARLQNGAVCSPALTECDTSSGC